MPMEEALEKRLQLAAPIAATGAGVAWDDRPKQLPWITLTKVSPGRDYTHQGPDGLDGPRIQIDCWSDSKKGRAALERAVLATMEASEDQDDTRFHRAWLEVSNWTREDDGPGGKPVFRSQQDFTVHHEEIAP